MHLAKCDSEDGTRTPTAENTSSIPPARTENHPCIILHVCTSKEASTSPPVTRLTETGRTPELPTNLKEKGACKPGQTTTLSSKRSSSNDHDTEDKDYVSSILELLRLDLKCKIMLDNKRKMLAHRERILGDQAIPFVIQVVHNHPQLFTEAQAQMTVAINAIR